MGRKVTLKDVSNVTGVSLASVHRAIHNKEGIGPDLRKYILEKSVELGYQTNYAASSLKRKTLTIALVFPSEQGNGRFYYKYFWDACNAYKAEIAALNVDMLEFRFDGDYESQSKLLDEIYLSYGTQIDGLLTVPLTNDYETTRSIERFINKGVSVVLVDNDIPNLERVCCVSPHDTYTGRLGAELLYAIAPKTGKVVISAGDPLSSSHIHNVKGFEAYLSEKGSALELLKVYDYSRPQHIYSTVCNYIRTHDDIVAFYAVTARDTLPLCSAVTDCGLAGKVTVIGSDLFAESAELLENDTAQALIYKNPYDKAYLGFKILFEAMAKGIVPDDHTVVVPISIILKNNLYFFKKYY